MLRYPQSRHCPPAIVLPTAALLLLALLVSALPATAQTATQFYDQPHGQTHKEHKRDYKHEVERLEEQWRLAQINGDESAMERLLAPDYLGISMTGQVTDRAQQLDRMRNRHLVLTKIEISDQKIKLVGTVAIVTSLAQIEGTNEGTPINGRYRYTRIYRRYPDGTWKVTNFEVTRTRDAGTDSQQP
jgi:ketosteroid isomerase-like protein